MGINVSYGKFDSFTFEKIMQVMTTILLGISLILLEIAYKKESRKIIEVMEELLGAGINEKSKYSAFKVHDDLTTRKRKICDIRFFSVRFICRNRRNENCIR